MPRKPIDSEFACGRLVAGQPINHYDFRSRTIFLLLLYKRRYMWYNK